VAAKTPTEILAATISAAQSATSVQVTSSTNAGGEKITLDATYSKQDSHARISLLGIDFETIRLGDTLYVKGTPAFDAQLERALGLKVPRNTWLKGPTTGALAQLAGFTEMKTELPVLLSSGGTITKGATTKIHGQPAIELEKHAKLYTGALYVATTGKPYPILLRKTTKETGETTFTDWNKPVTVDPPSTAIDISKLEHTKGG
jgi:hypothetical protein